MKEFSITCHFTEYDSRNELDHNDAALLSAADESGHNAYAPYSNFNVGAALRLSNGEIITGSNQENVAYPSGICAERVALFYAGAKFPDVPVEVLAITCQSAKFSFDRPLSPCGACRQVIAESERRYGKPIRIILAGQSGKVFVANSIKELLPLSFEAEELKG